MPRILYSTHFQRYRCNQIGLSNVHVVYAGSRVFLGNVEQLPLLDGAGVQTDDRRRHRAANAAVTMAKPSHAAQKISAAWGVRSQ